jgi:serine/threonine protein kinase
MIGQTISHYRILKKLGGGGMGIVYKAQDTRLGRAVALKFFPPELTRDPEAKERFVHEAKAASTLDHNNICTIHDIEQTDDHRILIVMDCNEGESLKQMIGQGPLPIDKAINIATQVAQGLSNAHESGIVHRDIKSSNIMISKDDITRIVDFGLAKLPFAGAYEQAIVYLILNEVPEPRTTAQRNVPVGLELPLGNWSA